MGSTIEDSVDSPFYELETLQGNNSNVDDHGEIIINYDDDSPLLMNMRDEDIISSEGINRAFVNLCQNLYPSETTMPHETKFAIAQWIWCLYMLFDPDEYTYVILLYIGNSFLLLLLACYKRRAKIEINEPESGTNTTRTGFGDDMKGRRHVSAIHLVPVLICSLFAGFFYNAQAMVGTPIVLLVIIFRVKYLERFQSMAAEASIRHLRILVRVIWFSNCVLFLIFSTGLNSDLSYCKWIERPEPWEAPEETLHPSETLDWYDDDPKVFNIDFDCTRANLYYLLHAAMNGVLLSLLWLIKQQTCQDLSQQQQYSYQKHLLVSDLIPVLLFWLLTFFDDGDEYELFVLLLLWILWALLSNLAPRRVAFSCETIWQKCFDPILGHLVGGICLRTRALEDSYFDSLREAEDREEEALREQQNRLAYLEEEAVHSRNRNYNEPKLKVIVALAAWSMIAIIFFTFTDDGKG